MFTLETLINKASPFCTCVDLTQLQRSQETVEVASWLLNTMTQTQYMPLVLQSTIQNMPQGPTHIRENTELNFIYLLQYHFLFNSTYMNQVKENVLSCYILFFVLMIYLELFKYVCMYVCMCTCTDNYFYWFHSKYSTAKSLNHSTIDEYSGYFCSIIKNTIKKEYT